MMDKIREWVSDNLRYILLALAVILVIIIAVFGIRAVTHSSSGSSGERNTARVAQTEEETEGETNEYGEAALVRNQTDILNIATEYWTAIGDQDYDTLERLCGREFSEEDRAKVRAMDVAVESYNNIITYSKPGLTDGSYVAYVYMDLKLTGIETPAPTLREMYLEPDGSGGLLVVPADDYTSQISSYTQMRQTDSDVQALITDVNDTLIERCVEDDNLARYVYSGSSESSEEEEPSAGEEEEDSSESAEEMEDAENDEEEEDHSSDTVIGTATVTEGVNVRSEASTNGEILSALYAGLTVEVYENLDNGWSRISFVDGTGATVSGYVKSDYLSQ